MLIAILAAWYRSKVARSQTPFLSDVRREWTEDRVILERMLSSEPNERRMTQRDDIARREILGRLAQSREELRQLVDPPQRDGDGTAGNPGEHHEGGFPRSRTMQMLMSGKGLGTVGAVVAGCSSRVRRWRCAC